MNDPSELRVVRVAVNGQVYERSVEARMLLCDFLRHELELTGTHVGCEHGVCGACTILLDGRSARSCLMFAAQANGREVTTIEGLASGEALHPLQKAFSEQHGLQCGFCTPGMLTTLAELLADNPSPSEDDVRDAISGNLCRCTGYEGIVKAALRAAETMRAQGGRK
jgi:carbon-monoxide dehydrogenase small subunit